jgi:hypothetical protein
MKRFVTNARAFLAAYDQLAAEYRGAYGTLTGNDYWQEKLGLAAGPERKAAE